MVEITASSRHCAALKGSFTMWSVPATVPYDEVLANLGEPILDAKNLVVNSALTVLVQLMRGNTNDYVPAYITIGNGGDLNQTSKLHMGIRVPAAITDTYVRMPVARIPIVLTEDATTTNSWYYVAVARPHEALAPVINELGVETRNGTLVSHYITDSDPSLGGRATRYVKTALEYLIIRWKYELALVVNALGEDVNTLEGTFLPFVLGDGTTIYVLLVEPRPGASTAQALLCQLEDGSYGTIDVQANGTILSNTSDGTPATIGTEDI